MIRVFIKCIAVLVYRHLYKDGEVDGLEGNNGGEDKENTCEGNAEEVEKKYANENNRVDYY